MPQVGSGKNVKFDEQEMIQEVRNDGSVSNLEESQDKCRLTQIPFFSDDYGKMYRERTSDGKNVLKQSHNI